MEYISPVYIRLPRVGPDVERFLTYDDRQVLFQIKRLKDQYRATHQDWILNKLEELKTQTKTTLLWEDVNGHYTLSGLAPLLSVRFGWKMPVMSSQTPKTTPFAYARAPKYPARYYQREAFDALKANRHAAVELSTGAGKSMILRDLCKTDPVKTIVVAPFEAIATQLYNDFVYHFGQKWVGMYGDGKKQSDKLITVAIAQSLVKIQKGSKAWEDFQKVNRFCFDESHLVPAETFMEMCTKLLANVPERYFVSATQMRTDGAELALTGITGPVVYRKYFRDLVSEGFLAKPIVRIFRVPETNAGHSQDAKRETRNHFYANPKVNEMAAQIAERMVLNGRQAIILIEEFRQFDILKNYLRVPFTFLHGGASKDAKEFLPEEYWKCDVAKSVAEFNEGKIKLIIGTSAISTGTDFLPVGCLIYLRGGTSEISVKQGLGRGTRLVEGKKDFFVVDFKVISSIPDDPDKPRRASTMERHLEARKEIYLELTDDVLEV